MGDFPGGSDIGLDLEMGGIMREHDEPGGLMAATTPTNRGFTYASNTPYVSREGYLGKLNKKQQSALESLQNYFLQQGIKMSDLDSSNDPAFAAYTLLRYLRANQFSLEKTIDHITTTVGWRREMNVRYILTQTPESLLGVDDLKSILDLYPHWHRSYDVHGRPVLFKKYGQFETSSLLEKTTIQGLMEYHVWEQEQCLELCRRQTRRTGHIVETFTCVIDIAGMTMRQVTRDFLKIVKTVAEIDQKYYPETMGSFYVINCPSAFPFVWRLVRPFLDAVVAAKIQIIANRAKWEPVLLAQIGEEALPEDYGGKGPVLSALEHPYAETVKVLAARRVEESSTVDLTELATTLANGSSTEETANREFISLDDISRDRSSRIPRLSRNVQSGWSAEIDFARKAIRANSRGGGDGGVIGVGIDDRPVWTLPVVGVSILQDLRQMRLSDIFGEEWDRADSEIGSDSDPGGDERDNEDEKTDLFSADSAARDRVTILSLLKSKRLRQKGVMRSTRRVGILLTWAIVLSVLMAVVAIALSGYLLSNMYWNSTTVALQMWTSVLVIVVSCFAIMLNMAGYVGVQHRNRPLLLMYGFYVGVITMLFFAVFVSCMLYLADVAAVTKQAYEFLPEDVSEEKADAAVREYNTVLGSWAFVAFLFFLCPFILTVIFWRRLHSELRLQPQPRQIRAMMMTSQALSLIFGFVNIAYGCYSLNLIMAVRLVVAVFPIYGMLYGGVTIILANIYGLWSTRTKYNELTRYYYVVVIPILLVTLIHSTVTCLDLIPNVSAEVDEAEAAGVLRLDHFAQHSGSGSNAGTEDELEYLKTVIMTQLVIAGIFGIFCCVLNLITFFGARALYHRIKEIRPYYIGTGVQNWRETERLRRVTRQQRPGAVDVGVGVGVGGGGRGVGGGGGGGRGSDGGSYQAPYSTVLSIMDGKSTDGHGNGHGHEHRHGGAVERRRTVRAERPLSFTERLVLSWGICMGMFCIYFRGTFAIFNDWEQPQDSGDVFVWHVWTVLGRFDSRFVGGDGFMVTSNIILSVVAGPLLLYYATCTFLRSPERHAVGPVCSFMLVYTQLLYYGIEIHSGFANTQADGKILSLIAFVAFQLLLILLPLLVFIYEVRQVYFRVKLADAADRGRLRHATAADEKGRWGGGQQQQQQQQGQEQQERQEQQQHGNKRQQQQQQQQGVQMQVQALPGTMRQQDSNFLSVAAPSKSTYQSGSGSFDTDGAASVVEDDKGAFVGGSYGADIGGMAAAAVRFFSSPSPSPMPASELERDDEEGGMETPAVRRVTGKAPRPFTDPPPRGKQQLGQQGGFFSPARPDRDRLGSSTSTSTITSRHAPATGTKEERGRGVAALPLERREAREKIQEKREGRKWSKKKTQQSSIK